MVVQEASEPYLPCLDNPSFAVFKCDDLKVGGLDTCEDGEKPKRYTCADYSEDFVTNGMNGTCKEDGAHACGVCPVACGSCDLCYQVYILFVTVHISRLILFSMLRSSVSGTFTAPCPFQSIRRRFCGLQKDLFYSHLQQSCASKLLAVFRYKKPLSVLCV